MFPILIISVRPASRKPHFPKLTIRRCPRFRKLITEIIIGGTVCQMEIFVLMPRVTDAAGCVTTRQMTERFRDRNVSTLPSVPACMPRDSGILLTNFACAYPSVNHGIFRVLDKVEAGILHFLKRSCKSVTRQEQHTRCPAEQTIEILMTYNF